MVWSTNFGHGSVSDSIYGDFQDDILSRWFEKKRVKKVERHVGRLKAIS